MRRWTDAVTAVLLVVMLIGAVALGFGWGSYREAERNQLNEIERLWQGVQTAEAWAQATRGDLKQLLAVTQDERQREIIQRMIEREFVSISSLRKESDDDEF